MMPAPRARSPRGVTLLEGLIATMILLIGMVGVLQGLAIASVQNAMANRHTRASVIAQELVSAVEHQGRARLVASGGLFSGSACAPTPPPGVAPFQGELQPLPPSLAARGFDAANACFIDFDALGVAFRALTPGYTAQDDTTYQRLVAVYRHPTNSEVLFIGVNVGWRDAGQVRLAKRFTALYDTSINQTNLEF